jgi:hypothetical protein
MVTYKDYIKADFTNRFPLVLGDKFFAKDKLGSVYHYQFCGFKNDPCGYNITICNDDPEHGYSQVEHEWFRQREIYLNPFNEALKENNLAESLETSNHRQYIKVVKYYPGTPDECWVVDYNSPSVGMSLKIEATEQLAQAFYDRLLSLSDDDLLDVLQRRGKLELVDLREYE